MSTGSLVRLASNRVVLLASITGWENKVYYPINTSVEAAEIGTQQ